MSNLVIRKYLKALLFQLAKSSENPGQELHRVVEEVLHELWTDVEEELAKRKAKFTLLPGGADGPAH